jgi:hypothetical protein
VLENKNELTRFITNQLVMFIITNDLVVYRIPEAFFPLAMREYQHICMKRSVRPWEFIEWFVDCNVTSGALVIFPITFDEALYMFT